jgi:hypothetical protein
MARRLLLVALAACGGGSSGSPDAARSPDAAAIGPDAAPASRRPPPPGPTHAPDGAGSTTFAIDKLYLGDTDPDGTIDHTNGWKNYGYDLDGKASTATSTDLCQLRNNASPANVYPDGPDGTDNSFGHHVLPIMLGLASDATAKVNESLDSGGPRPLFTLDALGSGTDYNPLDGADYAGLTLGSVPRYDGTDVWPIDNQSIVNGDVTMPVVQFPNSYVVGDTWVSGAPSSVEVDLHLDGFALPLVIDDATVTMVLSADHTHASHGIVAGVLHTDQLVAAFDVMAGSFDPQLCSGSTIDAINAQLEQASDILHDGTQDPTQPCDGISIGLGFDAAVVQLGTPGTAPTPVNPC